MADAKKRVFKAEKITQLAAKGFEAIGDAFEGTFTGLKHTTIADDDAPDGKRDATIILLKPDEGDRFGVWANAVLEDMIAAVKVGTYIRITHHAVGEKKGKKSPPKLFEIETAE